MRIALAVHHFPPKYLAGAELHAFQSARWMANNGDDIQIITIDSINSGSNGGVQAKDDEYCGLPVHRLSIDLSNPKVKSYWEYDHPWIYDHLIEYLGDIKPDIFHLISGYILGAGAIKAAYMHHIPVVATLTDFWFFCPRINLIKSDGTLSDPFSFDEHNCARCKFEEKRRYLLPAKLAPNIVDKFWEKSAESNWSNLLGIKATEKHFKERNRNLTEVLSKISAIVCPSQFLLESVRERRLPEEKLYFIQHGLDTSDWAPVNEVYENAAFHIGYVGQVDKHKGLHLLIDAFKRLETKLPMKLSIYGDHSSAPHYTKSLMKLANGDSRINFFGRVEHSQIAKLFSHLDVLVIPSIWYEIGPLVMYEGLEMKTIVLASDIPNMSHIINHEENGLLFECGNSQDLAYQLQRLIDDDNLRLRLVGGIKPVKTIDDEMKALNRVYQVVLNDNKSD